MRKSHPAMSHTAVVGLLVAMAAALAADVAEPQRITVRASNAAPAVDGKIDDTVWRTAATFAPFTELKSDQKTVDTRTQVAQDGKWLYLAMECDNPHMNLLTQMGKSHDDSGVCQDDSVEVFLSREGLNRYYHYAVSFANVRMEQRFSESEGRDRGWDYPWLSATTTCDSGWGVEIAIPLELLNTGKPGEVKLNLMRNKIEVEQDAMGAKAGEKHVYSFWSPVANGAHEPEHFGVVDGVAPQAPSPFLPQIAALRTGDLDFSGAQFRFDVHADLVGRSPVGGKARLEIVEHTPHGEKIVAKLVQDLPPRCEKSVKLTVPVADFAAKKLTLRLTDQSTGAKLDERSLDFQGNLIAEAYPEFSFYSREKLFRVKAVMVLSDAVLRGLSLSLLDAAGKVVASAESPTRDTVLSTDASALTPGANQFTLALLRRQDGKTLGTFKLSALRLEPGKGSESKVDHFRRAVLFNGEPFFPFGMYVYTMGQGSAIIRQLAAADMNTFLGMYACSPGGYNYASSEAIQADIKEAARNGLLFGFEDDINQCANKAENGPSTFSEKEVFLRDNFERNFKGNLQRFIPGLRDEPNLLFWYGVDEPNLRDWRCRLFVQSLWGGTLRGLDPRHVQFGLYARTIPEVPEATKLFDVLGYDVYTYPNWEGQYSDICGNMASNTSLLDKQAAALRQPVWIVPMGTSLDPHRSSRPLSGQEQLCQSYTAIIYGARGLLYFMQQSSYGKETWDTFRILGGQLKILSPAVLSGPVPQTVSYVSGSYDVNAWKCPPIPFRFFRFPDGKLVALAVNARNCPVDATVKVTGLHGARRMFGDSAPFEVTGNAFSDKLEPYAIRAYALESDAATLSASLADTPRLDQALALVSNNTLVKQAQGRKNKMVNGSLEQQKLAGLPDFCTPYRVLESETVGEKGSRWFLDTENPKFGKVSLRMSRYPALDGLRSWRAGAFVTSWGGGAGPHVFSFYARAAQDGAKLAVQISAKATRFTLTKDWVRYTMPTEGAGMTFILQGADGGETIWLDGFQLEKGDIATEFEE